MSLIKHARLPDLDAKPIATILKMVFAKVVEELANCTGMNDNEDSDLDPGTDLETEDNHGVARGFAASGGEGSLGSEHKAEN